MSNLIAIVGRPNVGKSTLFNRLINARKAIVDDVSGVTRDRHYGQSYWNGKDFSVIDTGGYVPNSEDVFEKAIREQVTIAMDEATHIIFMLDVNTGITDLDMEMTQILRKSKKEVFVAINKVDNADKQLEAYEFYSLGFEHVFFISSISGAGTGELLDRITEYLEETKPELPSDVPRFTILGRPNVGKSSLLNALVGEERNIVTDIAGTTRDTIHTHYKKFDKEYFLIDTAGIRKKAKVNENIEFYSVLRAIRSIDDADVCLLIVDATLGLEAQDINIYRLITRKGKGVVVLINKWDLVEKDTLTANAFREKIQEKLAPFNDVPILFISATEKQRIFQAMDTALEVYENRNTKISTSKLNDFVQEVIDRNPPPAFRGKYIKIKYATQLPVVVPSFALFTNHPKYIKEPYRNYIENQFRKQYNFTGVPIRIFFRPK